MRVARACFLKHGASVSAADIARELGVSHTTLFNRFGSKDALMMAALGPPTCASWAARMAEGPDPARPVRAQLVAHAKALATYFRELQQGLGVLEAAGLEVKKACAQRGESAPEHAYRALVGWISAAQAQGRLRPCDPRLVASSILSALQGWAMTQRVCGVAADVPSEFVESFIALLWEGVGVDVPPPAKTKPRR
jgi:AcrR family transcriptional regulator